MGWIWFPKANFYAPSNTYWFAGLQQTHTHTVLKCAEKVKPFCPLPWLRCKLPPPLPADYCPSPCLSIGRQQRHRCQTQKAQASTSTRIHKRAIIYFRKSNIQGRKGSHPWWAGDLPGWFPALGPTVRSCLLQKKTRRLPPGAQEWVPAS